MRPIKAAMLLLIISIVLVGAFVAWSDITYQAGFPLDDAWIHQTFARNLAERGEWAFNPGQPAAGSTAPLWTFLVAIGMKIGIPTFYWTMSLGIVLLGLTGWVAFRWFQAVHTPGRAILLAILIMSEWHLVWTAASGMETLLQAFLFLLVLLELQRETPGWIWIGVLGGLSLWTRPDGITLLGPVFVSILFALSKKDRWNRLIRFLLPFLLFLLTYLWFNLAISGTVWPNTLYAKQMEYGEGQTANIIIRYIQLWIAPLAGFGMLLLPGFVFGAYRAIRKKQVLRIAMYLWIVGYVFLYAWKLPVTYQHGRYILPILPIYLVLSITVLMEIDFSRWAQNLRFILTRSYSIAIIFVAILFLGLGARAYATDVAIIQQEMVEPAKWISTHLPQDAILAVHDIGAAGYFSGRTIVDLAGLIDPQIIPGLRNQEKLAEYIKQKKADYLMIFPNWYQPGLSLPLKKVYKSMGQFSPLAGGENMMIYKID